MNTKTKTQRQEEAREQARTELKKILKPGDRIRGIVTHVSRSGMARDIMFFAPDGTQLDDYMVVFGIGKWSDNGIRVTGTGMDMVFASVYSLGRNVYPDGVPCTGHRYTEKRANGRTVRACLSNDHTNGSATYTRGRKHSQGGYAYGTI